MTPAEVCRLGELNEGYLSELINGESKDPRLSYLRRIASVLDISVSTMLQPPPDDDVLKRIAGLDPAIVARLRRGPSSED